MCTNVLCMIWIDNPDLQMTTCLWKKKWHCHVVCAIDIILFVSFLIDLCLLMGWMYMENYVKWGLDCRKRVTMLFSVSNNDVYIKDKYAFAFQRYFISIENIFVISLHNICVHLLCIIWMTTQHVGHVFKTWHCNLWIYCASYRRQPCPSNKDMFAEKGITLPCCVPNSNAYLKTTLGLFFLTVSLNALSLIC